MKLFNWIFGRKQTETKIKKYPMPESTGNVYLDMVNIGNVIHANNELEKIHKSKVKNTCKKYYYKNVNIRATGCIYFTPEFLKRANPFNYSYVKVRYFPDTNRIVFIFTSDVTGYKLSHYSTKSGKVFNASSFMCRCDLNIKDWVGNYNPTRKGVMWQIFADKKMPNKIPKS